MNDNTPLIRFTPGKGGYYRDDSSTKPSGAPSSGKDFKKIMEKDEGESKGSDTYKKKLASKKTGDLEEGEEIALAEEATQAPAQPPASLFDLSKGAIAKEAPAPRKAPEEQPQPLADPLGGLAGQTIESPSKLYAKMTKEARKPFTLDAAQTQQPIQKEQPLPEEPVDIKTVAYQEIPHEPIVRDDLTKKDNFNAQFSREQPDLASANPLGINLQATPITPAEVKAEKPMTPAQSLQALVEQLAKEMSVMKVDGKSETTIVLKHPPLLEGSRIVITSFESARGEFNIQFENLTQSAQRILDQQQNRADLLLALEQKGYNVHILTTTTLDVNRIVTANVDQPNKDQGQRRDEEGKGEGGKRERSREEEE